MKTEIYSYTKERIEWLIRSAELYGSVTLSKDQMKDIGCLALEAIENRKKEVINPTKKFWDVVRFEGKPKTVDEAFTTLVRAGILNEDGSLSSNYYDVEGSI